MTKDIREFFEQRLKPGEGVYGEKRYYEIRYAAAALLIACAKSDFEEDPDEEDVIANLLETNFDVEPEMIQTLMELADRATSENGLEDFTQLVNEHYTTEDKRVLMEDLWRVAYADGRLDVYEERFINRVAGLIEVTAEFVKECRLGASGF